MERLARGFIALVQRLPLPALRRLGRCLGRLAFVLVVNRRRVALANLDLAYGTELSKSEKKKIARSSFENLFTTALECMYAPVLGPNFTDYAGLENIESFWEALGRGNGLIALVPHMGNWEMLARYVLNDGIVLHAVSRQQSKPWITRIVSDLRKANGIREIDKRNALKPVMAALRRGEIVCMLIDQHARKESVETTFFGKPAMTVASPALLALRTGCSVLLAASLRQPDGGIVLATSEIIETINTGDAAKDIRTNTQRYMDMIERFVRRDPQGWMWMHRRWRM